MSFTKKMILVLLLGVINGVLGGLLNGVDNDLKDEHFQLNFKSNTPDRMISHEMNEQRFYKQQQQQLPQMQQTLAVPLSANDILNHYQTLSLTRPQYFPKLFLNYQQTPQRLVTQQQQQQQQFQDVPQKLFNFHYHKNLGGTYDKMPQFDNLMQQQRQSSPLKKLVQYVQYPSNINSGDLQTSPVDFYDQQSQSGIQYNMMHLKLENVPQYGSLLTGEINNNGMKKPLIVASANDLPNLILKKFIKKQRPTILFKKRSANDNDEDSEDSIVRTRRGLDDETELSERADIDLNEDSDNSFYYPNSETKLASPESTN